MYMHQSLILTSQEKGVQFNCPFVDVQRRSLEYEERKYLVEMGYVTETQSNLGLLAVRSDDVLAVMQEEYPAKYKVSYVIMDMC